jgi:hypothetical protein
MSIDTWTGDFVDDPKPMAAIPTQVPQGDTGSNGMEEEPEFLHDEF